MGEEKEEKEKIINFWTWFDKKFRSFLRILADEEEELNEVYIYQIIRYPPKSNPSRHNREQLRLIFNEENMG